MSATLPPGWPRSVPPPGSADWESRAVMFLLDLAPGQFRTEPLYRRYPVVLAWRVGALIGAQLDAARAAYARARAELRDDVPPAVIDETLLALEREGAHLLAVQREVKLVTQALGGERYVPRL